MNDSKFRSLALFGSAMAMSLSLYFSSRAVTNSAEKITQNMTNEIIESFEYMAEESVEQLSNAIGNMTPEGLEALNIVLKIVQNAEGSIYHLQESIQLLHERVDSKDVKKILELIEKDGFYHTPPSEFEPFFDPNFGGEPYEYIIPEDIIDTIHI